METQPVARIIGNIPNFINGVSQQPAALRLASQAEEQTNCYSTVAKGLVRRPPTENIVRIEDSTLDGNSFVHFINRDTTERYVVVFDGTGATNADKVKVFDFDGVQKTVSFPDGTGYIPSDCRTNLEALTVADYTFVINKSKVVAEGSATIATRPYECLIAFNTVQPGSTVRVRVNENTVGVTNATLLLSDTDPSDLETHYVANSIQGTLATNLGANFTSHVLTETNGSVIYLANSTNDFDVTVSDGSGGLGIKVIKDKVQYFEDLPRQGKEGFKVEVAGDPVTGFGNYWVEFEKDTIPVWKETIKPGLKQGLDATSMPHQLIRNGDGTFTFSEVTWADRVVGDDDNNAMPSFVGETINDIFFTEARLAFLAGESVIMSEAGEFFNYFRTTVTTLVDGDPIDVGTNHTKVSILRHAVPYQEQLLLFSDQTQFRLTKGDLLSPSTVGIEPITEFESSIQAKPRPVGNFVFFAVEKSDYASIREYFVADDSLRNDAREITGHVPEYLPSGVSEIVGSSNEDILLIRSSGSTTDNELYVYKYFWSGQEKIQSSWSKWTFGDVTAIYGFEFIRSALYMVVQRADGVYLEKMELDTGAEDDTATGYILCADRKVFSAEPEVTMTYVGGDIDHTFITHSEIEWTTAPYCIGIEGNTEFPPGYEVTRTGISENLFTYSEQFDNAAWTKTNCAVTADSTAAPDGNTTADTITDDATSGLHMVSQTITGTAESYTLSTYVKAGTITDVRLNAWNGTSDAYCDFDLNAGTAGTPVGATAASITGLPGGWYRVSITATLAAASCTLSIRLYDGAVSYVGTSKTLYLWGAQIEKSSSANPYIKTVATAEDQALIYSGDLTAEGFMFGIPYESSYTLSEIVPKTAKGEGAVPVSEGRLQLFWMNFRYAFTGYFKFTVSVQDRADNEYEFNGRTLGDSITNPINDLPIDGSGTYRFPIYSKSERATVKLTSSDVLPFRIISGDWIGNFFQKFRRM